MRPLSPTQSRCIIEATIEPLFPFRRGFARSKAGPFYNLQTVHRLIETGALRFVRNGPVALVTARAA